VRQSPYSASGDGAHDDTKAIVAAVKDAELHHGTVVLPCGTYLLSGEIVIDARITIQGHGAGQGDQGTKSCTILKKTTDTVAIHIKSTAGHTILRDFELTSTAQTGDADGIVVGDPDASGGASETEIRSVTVTRLRGNGIHIRNGNAGILAHVIAVGNAGSGILISSESKQGDNTNAWRVFSPTLVGNGRDGLRIELASSTSVIGLVAEGNAQYGVFANRPYTFIEGYTEGNKSNNVYLGDSCFDCFTVIRDVNNSSYQGNPSSFMFNMAGKGITPGLSASNGRLSVHGAFSVPVVKAPFASAVSIDNTKGNVFVIDASGPQPFTIEAPRDHSASERITITIRNVSGKELGAATWNPAYHLSHWDNPANGFSRSIDFQLEPSGNWIEVGSTPADVPN
jgi:hypothetical protein